MFEEKLKIYDEAARIPVREEAVQRTVQRSRAAFYENQRNEVASYWEFLLAQFRIVQKRWWGLQFLVLLSFWLLFRPAAELGVVHRSMGIAATLFIVLVIPELWKNRSSQSMEVEAASYYSLRQIYAARMTLFGIVDVILVTLFCGMASAALDLAMAELLTQFLFPMVVTACICFGVLCSKRCFSEFFAIGLCLIWSALWWLLVLNEDFYAQIALPVWLGLLAMALAFLAFAIHRTLKGCNNFWEVNLNGIET